MKSLLIIIGVFCLLSLAMMPVLAQPNLGIDYATNLSLSATNDDPRDAAVSVVKYLLTFIALIATLVIIYGVVGAVNADNEERGSKARKTIIAGVIGLVVILAAFAIVTFVINTTGNLLN